MHLRQSWYLNEAEQQRSPISLLSHEKAASEEFLTRSKVFKHHICSLIFYNSLILPVKCFTEVTWQRSDQIYAKQMHSGCLMMWFGVLFFDLFAQERLAGSRSVLCLFAFNEVWCNLRANSDAIQLFKSCGPVNGCLGKMTLHGKQTPKSPDVNTANLRIRAYGTSIVRANSLENDFH